MVRNVYDGAAECRIARPRSSVAFIRAHADDLTLASSSESLVASGRCAATAFDGVSPDQDNVGRLQN